MQKFNPSKGYWRITPQNRFHCKGHRQKNIVIFKNETREKSLVLKIKFILSPKSKKAFFTFHDNKVHFCSVFEKKFFYL